MFRAHFEVIIGKKSIVCPSVSWFIFNVFKGTMNLWFALMIIYAGIYKLHKGIYENYDCTQAIEFIFEGDFKRNLDSLDFSWIIH
jgi:hypothetical protein